VLTGNPPIVNRSQNKGLRAALESMQVFNPASGFLHPTSEMNQLP
jgi:hypothetical protein